MSDPDDGDRRNLAAHAPAQVTDDEAVDWVIRMAEPDANWDRFNEWLEQDPTRAERYDRAAAALQDAEAIVATLPSEPASRHLLVAEVPTLARRRPARWMGGALAAALVGAVGVGVWTQVPRPYEVETAAGEQRTVRLADGSSIFVAGASKIRLDHHDPRLATVERGEMLFRVRHDADRPFTVQVGDLRLVDLGTVFDVKSAGGRTRIAVAEGAVMVDPDGAAMRLGAGQAMLAEGSTIERLTVDPQSVGSWRSGRLAFDGETLADVARDLSRQTGRQITVAPAIAQQQFRGAIDVRAVADRPTLLAALLNVEVRTDEAGWILEPRRR